MDKTSKKFIIFGSVNMRWISNVIDLSSVWLRKKGWKLKNNENFQILDCQFLEICRWDKKKTILNRKQSYISSSCNSENRGFRCICSSIHTINSSDLSSFFWVISLKNLEISCTDNLLETTAVLASGFTNFTFDPKWAEDKQNFTVGPKWVGNYRCSCLWFHEFHFRS